MRWPNTRTGRNTDDLDRPARDTVQAHQLHAIERVVLRKPEQLDGSVSPATPGEILEEEFLKPMGLSKYRSAEDMGVLIQLIGDIVGISVAGACWSSPAYSVVLSHGNGHAVPIIDLYESLKDAGVIARFAMMKEYFVKNYKTSIIDVLIFLEKNEINITISTFHAFGVHNSSANLRHSCQFY